MWPFICGNLRGDGVTEMKMKNRVAKAQRRPCLTCQMAPNSSTQIPLSTPPPQPTYYPLSVLLEVYPLL